MEIRSSSNFKAEYTIQTGVSKLKKRKAEEEYWASLAGPVTVRKIEKDIDSK